MNDVTVEQWEQRKAFAGFTDEDVVLLRELHSTMAAHVDEIVDELYRHFLAWEETRAFFPDQATIARVKATQKQYFLELTAGEYGATYLERRLEVGRVHQRIGLSTGWYMSSYAVYMQIALSYALSAFPDDTERSRRGALALLKIMALDKELAVTTYVRQSEGVITQQSREILDAAVPVVQVWEEILAVPLIGTLDTRRAEQFTERLLDCVVRMNCSIVLMDLTGVPVIDTGTAQHLLETVAAVRLLGARVVLTGIRPVIAQTLVHLGIDLSAIVTRASLAAGLRFALDTLKLRIVREQNSRG